MAQRLMLATAPARIIWASKKQRRREEIISSRKNRRRGGVTRRNARSSVRPRSAGITVAARSASGAP